MASRVRRRSEGGIAASEGGLMGMRRAVRSWWKRGRGGVGMGESWLDGWEMTEDWRRNTN